MGRPSVSARLTTDLKGFGRYVKALGKGLKPAVLRGMDNAALRIIPILHQSVIEAPPASPNGAVGAFDTGALRRGYRTRRTANSVMIFNSVAHDPIVEKGRRRGAAMPPLKVIEQWARRRMGLSAEEAKRAAYPIAKAISKRGLKGRRVVGRVRERMMLVVREEIKLSLAEAAKAARAGVKK